MQSGYWMMVRMYQGTNRTSQYPTNSWTALGEVQMMIYGFTSRFSKSKIIFF